MAYRLLHTEFSDVLLQKPDELLEEENRQYKVFLRVVANYALTLDMGFDTLLLVKNTECAIHLLRMLLDTSVRTYGLLLAKNPEKYMNDYLQDYVDDDDFAATNINKIDNTPLLDSNIIAYMESE